MANLPKDNLTVLIKVPELESKTNDVEMYIYEPIFMHDAESFLKVGSIYATPRAMLTRTVQKAAF